MSKFSSSVVFGSAVLGIALVCHMIGDFGHRQGVDVLIIAPTILAIAFTGMFSLIYKFEI